jgi:hypothetical protein
MTVVYNVFVILRRRMMKRMLLLFACCLYPAYGGYEYADRVIAAGEYAYTLDWLSGVLVVDGGGADWIEVRNSSRLEVWSTSVPLGLDVGGIMDLVILNSHLDYYGGLTEELTIGGQNATVYLAGGRIDFISSYQYVTWVDGKPTGQHIHIHAQDGWEWKYENGLIKGVKGLWLDGSAFDIRFIDKAGYDPVWANVYIPEPASLLLMTLGGLLLRRRH